MKELFGYTVYVKKGDVVSIKHIIGETLYDVAREISTGNFVFFKDAIIYVETHFSQIMGESFSKDEMMKIFHLREAREFFHGKKFGNNFKPWPRLRKACQKAGLKPVNIPGGGIPFHYEDEIIVPDYKMSGSHFFIVPKSEIGKLLEMVPLDESEREREKERRKNF